MQYNGYHLHPGFLNRERQGRLLMQIRAILQVAPLYRPQMPKTGKPFSVCMSNCGPLGWMSDKNGYRYQKNHPETGLPWPQMPPLLLETWVALTQYHAPPEACLINYYNENASLGLHRDEDEEEVNAPIVSFSLGDTALFRMGGIHRKDPTRSVRINSGDIVVMANEARLSYHGVDRIYPGSSRLVEEGGRFNLTLRRVNLT